MQKKEKEKKKKERNITESRQLYVLKLEIIFKGHTLVCTYCVFKIIQLLESWYYVILL